MGNVALDTLSGLWPLWKANEHEQQLCRERLGHLNQSKLTEAVKQVRLEVGGKTPPLSKIASRYDDLVRAERAATAGPESATFTPNYYFVLHWEHREGYARPLEVAVQFPSAERAWRFVKSLGPAESPIKSARVTNCLGRRFDVVDNGLVDTVTGALVHVGGGS